MFEELDPVLHSQARLAIMSVLIHVESAEFAYLLENINTTKGNLSFQLCKLKEAGYIEVIKSLKGNYPLTTCKITQAGVDAYETYVSAITSYLEKFNQKTENN